MVAVGTVMSGLTALAINESVQADALRLVKDVYGRIMPGRAVVPSAEPTESVASNATREEQVAALALLQAQPQEAIDSAMASLQNEADRRQRMLVTCIGLIIILQVAMIVAILWR